MTLLTSTHNPDIDRLLTGLIGIYEMAFPQQISAYYLLGSYTDQTAAADSDLDLIAIFSGSPDPADMARFRQLTAYCGQITSVQLDCVPLAEATLQQGAKASHKAGHLLYGVDVLKDVPLEPLDEHIQRCMFLAFRALHVLRGQPETLTYPLDYPDSTGEFYGYERYGSYLGGDDFGPGLRILVTGATMIATTLLALQTGLQAGTKGAALALYTEHIGDEYAGYLQTLYQACKLDWRYTIPQAEANREQLRELCVQFLALENHFLAACRPTLQANLQSENQTLQHFAHECDQRIRV